MKIYLSIFLILCSAFASSGQQKEPFKYQGKVLSITAGNSLVLQIENHKISVTLIGTEAVEKNYPTATESREQLSRLLKNSEVTFVSKKALDLTKETSAIGKILINNQDAALSQLQAGLAIITTGENDLSVEDKNLYEKAEQTAAQMKKGLWRTDLTCKDNANGTSEQVAPSALTGTAKIRIFGTVIVRVTIDESGNVVEATALCGNPYLRSSSVNAALKSKFKPTMLGGRTVRVTGNIIYNFKPE